MNDGPVVRISHALPAANFTTNVNHSTKPSIANEHPMKTLSIPNRCLTFAVRKVALSVALVAATIAARADHFYTNNATGDYNIPAFWDPNGVPNDNTHNNNGSNNIVLIQAADPVWNHGDTLAGDANGASGAYLQTGFGPCLRLLARLMEDP